MKITELDDRGSDDSGGRELVPVKAKRALVGAGARVLFYPTLLYNLFRNKIQAEFRWWDQIDQFLLLGAVPFPKDVPRLRNLGVRGVITLNESYETLVPSSLYQAHQIDHLVIPTRDYLFAPSLVDINRAVDFIQRNSSCGRTTYVHCKAGRGRSTTIVLCYLVRYKHMTPVTALDYVRSRRPRVLLAPSQWRAVEEYSKLKLAFPAISNRMATASPPRGDEVLITHADLEGFSTNESTCCRDLCISSYRVVHTSPLAGDEVLVTDADLEGYKVGVDDDACHDRSVVTSYRSVPSRPMMAKLAVLFAAWKVSSDCPPVTSRLQEIRAC